MGTKVRIANKGLRALAFAAVSLIACQKAQDNIKVGVIAPFSGPFASTGMEIETGMRAYLKQHGETVAGRKIELIVKDTTGPSPEIAKRLAQELVVRDKVDFLAGFSFTPEALAGGAVATAANKQRVRMNEA